MDYFSYYGRSELKYFFSPERNQEIRDYIASYTELDPHSAERKDHNYTVRSIYFDTDNFDFYHDKKEGRKIRKKIRVRTYNEYFSNQYAFLEIKRRYANKIIKERAKVPLSAIEELHSSIENLSLDDRELPDDKNIIDKYLYNIKRFHLRPTMLVSYEREAYRGIMHNHERVTFDKNVRCYFYPEINDLFRENGLLPVTNNYSILELKFENFMPKWMIRLVRELCLRAESIPKYCMGVDTCITMDARTSAKPVMKRMDNHV